jgi:predicted nuclease of restriction endonuclease-like RecB superfamily
MLTGKTVRVRYARDRIVPVYLDLDNSTWQEAAERLLTLFRGQEGATRAALVDDLKEMFGDDPNQIVYQGLAKLLEDRCEFEVAAGHPPEQLRELVFLEAAGRRRDGGVAGKPSWRRSRASWE